MKLFNEASEEIFFKLLTDRFGCRFEVAETSADVGAFVSAALRLFLLKSVFCVQKFEK